MNLSSLGHAPLLGWLGLAICLTPLIAAVAYAIRPDEQRLAVMRPLSLAAIFASAANLLLGLANALRSAGAGSAAGQGELLSAAAMLGEALIPSYLGLAFLTAAWLCVAATIRRSA